MPENQPTRAIVIKLHFDYVTGVIKAEGGHEYGVEFGGSWAGGSDMTAQ